MTTAHFLLAPITGLAVTEFSEVCPWAARKLVRWSAHRRYAPPARAELRAEELAAYVDDRPGRLFKLITALGFAAAAVVTRKTAPHFAPPNPLWQPTKLTIPVHYEDGESMDFLENPKARVVRQAWCELTDEVLNAAKEVGVGSRSWRRCIKELQRITGDDRWTLVANNLDLLEKINNTPGKRTRNETKFHSRGTYVIPHFSFMTDSTVKHYQAAIETARVEICHLVSDFLHSSAPR